ncbi:hypothetical protein, partial [Pseudomonas sp. PA-5-4G]|uniref:hypothetical protein n=1 Tax=Pseudomonas sp. PA-5-4G TaxID=2665479 RepID=UPI001F2F271D
PNRPIGASDRPGVLIMGLLRSPTQGKPARHNKPARHTSSFHFNYPPFSQNHRKFRTVHIVTSFLSYKKPLETVQSLGSVLD